jgi:starvation-inducible DNA-binding protein
MEKKLTWIGLDKEKSRVVADELNILLSNYELYYQNLRGFHWNINGEKFFELHVKFEELYTDVQMKIDLVAERILTLGFTPLHTFSDYLKTSAIKEANNITGGTEAVKNIVKSLRTIIILEREILEHTAKLGDEGTTTMLTDFITQQEKEVWMFSAWLGK